MPTIYPKRRTRNTYCVDPVDMNENFLAYAEAAGGQLGEQNFKNGAFTSSTSDRDKFAANAGFTVRKAIQDVDHTSINNGTKATAAANARTANAFEIPLTGAWAEVTGATLDFETVGGLAFIFARALYWNTTTEATPTANTNVPQDDPGIMIAIRVDGNLIPESIMGSAELGNDLVGLFDSPGLCVSSQDMHPVACRTLEFLTPGRHTIELMARLCGPQDQADYHFLLTREINVLEIGAG